jgi:hypothetical protein
MHTLSTRRRLGTIVCLGLAAVAATTWPVAAEDVTPEQARAIIPWKQLDARQRAKLEAVVADPTVFVRSPVEIFEARPDLYYLLLREPELTVGLWRQLGVSTATLEKDAAGQFSGDDGCGSSGRWEFVFQSDDVHVIYCEGRYRGMFLTSALETRSVLVVRTVCFEDTLGRHLVKHQVDAYLKVDAGSLKRLALALKPLLHKSVEMSAQQTQWAVSMMCRVALSNPQGIVQALDQLPRVPEVPAKKLRELLPDRTASRSPISKRAARP